MDDKYFVGLCMLCHHAKNVRHIDIYVMGSEGFYSCKECENNILIPAIREMIQTGGRLKKEKFKKLKQIGNPSIL